MARSGKRGRRVGKGKPTPAKVEAILDAVRNDGPVTLRDRVVGFERVPASSLRPHPENWRRHPKEQAAALRGVMREVGFAGAVLARRTEGGGLEIIDGHLRHELLGQQAVPVIVTDLTAEEARYLLAVHDPLAAMAEADGDGLRRLLETIRSDELSVQRLLARMRADAKMSNEASGPRAMPVFPLAVIEEAAFAHFRATGFPYRALTRHECMQEINALAAMPSDNLLMTNAGYHVADTYHPHRFHGAAEGMRSPISAFAHDGLLRKALRLALEDGRSLGRDYPTTLNIVSGVQACANFRPGFALLLYRRFCPSGGIILDTSTGYGGRLVGFLASDAALYVGIDPSTLTHEGNTKLARDLGVADRIELHNLPAEEVPTEAVRGRCDFAFTSPPYFRKERYADEGTQSNLRFRDPAAWREGFLAPMLRLQFAALRPGSMSAINVADVLIGNSTYPVTEWVLEAATAAGFEHVGTEQFQTRGRRVGPGPSEPVAIEPVLLFRKAV